MAPMRYLIVGFITLTIVVVCLIILIGRSPACTQTDYDAGRCYDINHCAAQDHHKGYC